MRHADLDIGQAKAILFSFIASFDASQRKELEEQL